MSVERKTFREKVAEFSKKLDILQIAAGGVIYIFNAGVGFVIIAGSTITYGLAEQYRRGQERKRQMGAAA